MSISRQYKKLPCNFFAHRVYLNPCLKRTYTVHVEINISVAYALGRLKKKSKRLKICWCGFFQESHEGGHESKAASAGLVLKWSEFAKFDCVASPSIN